jgi:hypothetical protein
MAVVNKPPTAQRRNIALCFDPRNRSPQLEVSRDGLIVRFFGDASSSPSGTHSIECVVATFLVRFADVDTC